MFRNGIDKLFAYIVCFVFVLIAAFFVVPIAINNIIAMDVERDIKKLPLPQDTQLCETQHLAADCNCFGINGSENGTYCCGAALIKSDLQLSELKEHYNALSSKERWYNVVHKTDNKPFYEFMEFSHKVDNSGNYYVVYAFGKNLGDVLGFHFFLF